MLLSIITINFNSGPGLEKTIMSVLCQNWKNFEFIVIDGGSSDESKLALQKYHFCIDHLVSERDNGIYHAMNKGIALASGEYLLMLNAGDALFDKWTLQNIFGTLAPTEDIVYGDVLRESKGSIFAESRFPDYISYEFLRNGSLSHQATFIKRVLHQQIGMYDESLRLCSDWKFLILAACKFKATSKHLEMLVSICNADGMTCSPKYFRLMRHERTLVLKEHFNEKNLDTILPQGKLLAFIKYRFRQYSRLLKFN